jgi:hypothetical protein
VGVEDFENACRSLTAIKEKAPFPPFIITCDFNPALIAAIRTIFPESAVQIDGFHVMQELNNGIKRDFKRYRNARYQDEITELLEFRAYLNEFQKLRRHSNYLTIEQIPRLETIDRSHSGATVCREVIKKLISLLIEQDPRAFFITLDNTLNALFQKYGELVKDFYTSLLSKFPKRTFTSKGLIRVKEELVKKLKTFCLKIRKPLKEAAREFSKTQYLLFLQPEKVTSEVEARIREFLDQHPALKEYRDMTLAIGELYRTPYGLVDGWQIDALTQRKKYSDKLNTAIATLKKYKSEIIAFAKVFLEHPELEKACRANMEWLNKRVKAPFKASLNRQGLQHAIDRMQLQLGGEVRNFIT